MSRQFRFFLLPSDAEALIADLRQKIGLKLIDAKSSGPRPFEIDSPMHNIPAHGDRKASVSTYCYLMADADADLKMRYIAKQEYWHIDDERSEVIQFSGLEFDGEILLQGRFYFKTNFLLGDAIWPRRNEFLQWGDRIFRRSKRILQYDKGLDSYVGEYANTWRATGGRFAWMWLANREPYWAVERK